MSREVPSLGEGYVRYRGLLLSALGKLCAQGFYVWFDEASDLLHDFFVEEWEKVTNRYDPARGEFEPYLYSAFIYFARPRIIRLGRTRQHLVDLHAVAEQLGVEAEPSELTEPRIDSSVVTKAIGTLSEKESSVFARFLYEGRSERDLADQFRLSRYGVRNLLLDAMGRIVLQIGKPPGLSEDDWRVALLLWDEGRSPLAAAVELGVSPSRVRAARDRFRVTMTSILRAGLPRSSRAKTKGEGRHD